MSDTAVLAPARTSRLITSVVFTLHALVFATWTPYIPLVKARLGLSDGQLGIALLGGPVGALLAILTTGALVAWLGSRRVMVVTAVGYGLTAGLLGFADSLTTLFLALALWGAFQGSLDVAMNAQSVLVERTYGRSVLSSFHAFWSAGAAAGGALGGLAISFGLGLSTQMWLVGALIAVFVPVAARLLLTGDRVVAEQEKAEKAPLPFRDGKLLALGGLMLAAVLCEGAAAEWSALYLKENLGTSPSFAGFAFSVFALMMFLGRAMGDRWVTRFGGRAVVGVLASVAVVVFSGALLIGEPWAALLGFATLGLGIACAVPVVFSSAAALPGRNAASAIAAVSAAAWPGFLLGPPMIGGLAQAFTLPVALFVLPVLCAVVVLGARVVLRGKQV
ncbi:MFS family permease [Crossiella equi]|uniref:MFS family permease n=1 Tax=Crossiella equi TaxID=130796 RepID=A0ABS5A831_9PSEU|nr:MFS transporter [Crossiella equi]MBP2472741.1 MFS family permease [Crossiella equi]